MLEWILLGVLGLVLVVVIYYYNQFVTLRNRIDNAWAQIDVQLKRRYDLIPNLVNTVKGYARHEKSTFEMVTKARSALYSAKTPGEKASADNMLTSALKSVFAVAEAYPALRANENFKSLQEELAGTESKIAFSRQFYNDNVMEYNTLVQSFPSNLIAGLVGAKERQYFEVDEAERKKMGKAPEVKFDE